MAVQVIIIEVPTMQEHTMVIMQVVAKVVVMEEGIMLGGGGRALLRD